MNPLRISGSEPSNLTGSLLVALPTLLDPNFRRTILFLVRHEPSAGAMGVILNRPRGSRLPHLDDSVPEGLGEVPVFEGGPVETRQVILARMIVANSSTRFKALDDTEDGVGLARGEVRAFVGHAGWSAGQLEQEIAEKSWITLSPSPELLVAPESTDEGAGLWRALMRSLGPWYHLLSLAPDNPGLN